MQFRSLMADSPCDALAKTIVVFSSGSDALFPSPSSQDPLAGSMADVNWPQIQHCLGASMRRSEEGCHPRGWHLRLHLRKKVKTCQKQIVAYRRALFILAAFAVLDRKRTNV